jgi:hypothetical protein
MLILETVILGGAKYTAAGDLLGVMGEDLEGHGVPDVMGHSQPPSWFFLGGRERFIGIQVEDFLVEFVFEESGYVLESSVSCLKWNLVVDRFVRADIVDICNILACS